MAPREENKENLSQDVGGRDVEVVFESRDGDIAIYLRPHIREKTSILRRPGDVRFVPYTPDRPSRLSVRLGSPFGRSDRS